MGIFEGLRGSMGIFGVFLGSIEVLGWSTAVLHFFGCSWGLTGYLRHQIGGKRGFSGVVREVCRFLGSF